MIDLGSFAAAVGSEGPVTVVGHGTRGGAVANTRQVHAPSGVDFVQADEMIICCGAGTPIAEVKATLRGFGQTVALPDGGTVGGALSVGQSGIRRLGDGPVRDTLLQARFVGADGSVVTAGGPTVKNVSGFDLCRLLVGSRGTLGFLGEVLLRTRPLARHSQWFNAPCSDPRVVQRMLYRPVSLLWNGSTLWALLEGHPVDVAEQASAASLRPVDGPPPLPTGSRRALSPSAITQLSGTYVAEVGVGIVHHAEPWKPPALAPRVQQLNDALRREFDPTGRLNPGLTV